MPMLHISPPLALTPLFATLIARYYVYSLMLPFSHAIFIVADCCVYFAAITGFILPPAVFALIFADAAPITPFFFFITPPLILIAAFAIFALFRFCRFFITPLRRFY